MKKTSLKVLLGTVMILVFISTLFIFSKVNATETQEREVDYSDENNLDGEVSEDLDVNEGFTEDDTFTADDLTDSSEIYEKDLYEFSQGDYTLEKIVNGNVFIMCSGNVTIKSQINGSLYVLAKSIDITSEAYIVDAVYAMGTNVKLDASVFDFYVVAQNLEMGENTFIQRDLRVAAKNSNLIGTVYRDAYISSDVINTTKDESKLFIYGNLEYSSKEKIENPETIVPTGEVKFNQVEQKEQTTQKANIGSKFMNLIQKIIFAAAIYFVLAFVSPKFNEKLADYISGKSIKTVLKGLLGLIVIPVISVLLMITVVGLPLGFILLGLYIIAIILSTTLANIAISNKVAEKLNLDKNIWTKLLSLVIVVTVIYVLKLIPVVSGIIGIITVLLGFGIIIASVFSKNKETQISE